MFRKFFWGSFWKGSFFPKSINLIIYTSMFALYDAFDNLSMANMSSCIKLYNNRKCEFWTSRMKTTKIIRKNWRKHRNNFSRSIHTCCPIKSSCIKNTSFSYILCHIRNMNRKFISIFELFYRNGIIEVFCISSINRKNKLISKVSSVRYISSNKRARRKFSRGFRIFLLDFLCLFENSLRKRRMNASAEK